MSFIFENMPGFALVTQNMPAPSLAARLQQHHAMPLARAKELPDFTTVIMTKNCIM